GRGHPVLPGPGLGDDPLLAQPLGQQSLAQHVVDLVRPGVVEVLALEDHPDPTAVLGEPRYLGDDAGTTGVRPVQTRQLLGERRVRLGLLVGRGELVQRLDQRLGDEPAAEVTEVAGPGHWRTARSDGWAPAATRSA